MDFSGFTDEELSQIVADAEAEMSRRSYVANAPAIIQEVNQKVLAILGQTVGGSWVQPTGAHDAYPEGWEVVKDGKTWISLTNANVWAPGTSGWREKVTAPVGAAAWVQPTGAHDAYSLGDRVTHKGALWVSTNPGKNTNTWEPGVYGWTKVL